MCSRHLACSQSVAGEHFSVNVNTALTAIQHCFGRLPAAAALAPLCYSARNSHVCTGKGGIARSRLNAANVSKQNGTDRAIAAMAPAPLAAAPEQALKAEVSETASEPELLFAPDFIISQVSHKLTTTINRSCQTARTCSALTHERTASICSTTSLSCKAGSASRVKQQCST